MSLKTIITCDRCGKEVGEDDASTTAESVLFSKGQVGSPFFKAQIQGEVRKDYCFDCFYKEFFDAVETLQHAMFL